MRFRRAASLIVGMLALTSAGAAAAPANAVVSVAAPPGALIDTITLSPHTCPCPDYIRGKVRLNAGTEYTLVVSGTRVSVGTDLVDSKGNSVAASFSNDPLYQLATSGNNTECSAGCPRRMESFVVGIEGHPLTAIDRSPPQSVPYSPAHSYQVSFVPQFSGRFATNDAFGYGPPPRYTPTGSFTVQIYQARPGLFTLEGKRFHPASGAVQAGDTIQVCNLDAFYHRLHSYSRYNAFGNDDKGHRNTSGKPESPLTLRPAGGTRTCAKLTVRNPTSAVIMFVIFDEIHSKERLSLRVQPAS